MESIKCFHCIILVKFWPDCFGKMSKFGKHHIQLIYCSPYTLQFWQVATIRRKYHLFSVQESVKAAHRSSVVVLQSVCDGSPGISVFFSKNRTNFTQSWLHFHLYLPQIRDKGDIYIPLIPFCFPYCVIKWFTNWRFYPKKGAGVLKNIETPRI